MSDAGRGPLLTAEVHAVLAQALASGATQCDCSLDLGLTIAPVGLAAAEITVGDAPYPWPGRLKDRTIYYWNGAQFAPVSIYAGSLIKLVPTQWGAPSFEIDGIKMLPSARESPFADARRKVELVGVRGLRVLDTCGGLGYFAAWSLQLGAARIVSCEKNLHVLWLREINPWSPRPGAALEVLNVSIDAHISAFADASFDVVLHDPPRFGTAGELYSRRFYTQLARVLVPGGMLFHYTGSPNKLTSARDVPGEVLRRLEQCGFQGRRALDGIIARSVLKSIG